MAFDLLIGYKLLNIEEFVSQCSRHIVEKQHKESHNTQEYKCFDNCPLVVLPQNVVQTLQWIHEPHKGAVRPAGKRSNMIGQFKKIQGF